MTRHEILFALLWMPLIVGAFTFVVVFGSLCLARWLSDIPEDALVWRGGANGHGE